MSVLCPILARRFMRLLLAAALFLLATPMTARASEMQLQDYGLWTYYQFTDNGLPTGTVDQSSWQQFFAVAYVSHNTEGEKVAQAHQTGLYKGRLFWRNAEITFTSMQGDVLGRLRGTLWTPLAASFELTGPTGMPVAHLTSDYHAQFISVRDPACWHRLMGYMNRVQQATQGKDSWVVSWPNQTSDIDERVWPLIGAFFADGWSSFAYRHTEG